GARPTASSGARALCGARQPGTTRFGVADAGTCGSHDGRDRLASCCAAGACTTMTSQVRTGERECWPTSPVPAHACSSTPASRGQACMAQDHRLWHGMSWKPAEASHVVVDLLRPLTFENMFESPECL